MFYFKNNSLVENKKKHSEQCSNALECNDTSGLICSGKNICDCPKEINNEKFWFLDHCLTAQSFNFSCSKDSECQTITEKTFCDRNSNNTCQCVDDEFFNIIEKKCGKILINKKNYILL
jgi:hypothetical protein